MKKKQAMEVAQQVNDLKRDIDELKEHLEKTKTLKNLSGNYDLKLGGESILDQTEYQNIQKLKQLKTEYKKTYDALKPLRADIEYCFKTTDQSRQKLMSEFEQWYESLHGPQLKNNDQAVDVQLN
jgi:kinesin family protein 6/9